jgi:quinol monooxygenase YgiN
MSDATVPVIVTAYFFPRPDARDQVIAALEPAIAGVHEEDGCELYAIHDAPDGTIVMLEKWTSVELLDAHGQGEPVRKLGAALEGLLERPVEVTRLVPRPVGDAVKGSL